MKKILKIFGIILMLVFVGSIVAFYRFSIPSTSKKITANFNKNNTEVFIENRVFKSFKLIVEFII